MPETGKTENPEWRAIVARWKNKVAAGLPVKGVAVGSALTAAKADRDGVDFIVINNSGRFRGAGFGIIASLMPYDDANAVVLGLAADVIAEVRRTPVLAGLCGVDPFRLPRTLMRDAARVGYAGVQNFPSVGFFDGRFRRQIERSGLGYNLEVDMIRLARELGLPSVSLVFTCEEALDMARAGADVLVFHRGLAVPGEEPDPRRNAQGYREAMTPVLNVCPDAILLNQSAGFALDREFLECLGGRPACHGFFADGE
jgi:predicted TIM-barrel enzyme